jgi:orotate phosphoribosyltransferase
MLSSTLFKIGCIQFGTFTLKSGIISPIYIDLRPIISYPKLLGFITDQLIEKSKALDYDRVCGIPYTALPLATAFSLRTQTPMLLRRKEPKNYGTKRLVEGVYTPQDKCLIIEDIITSGSSVLETCNILKNEKLSIDSILVVLDREQGGRTILEKQNYSVHSLLTLSEVLNELHSQHTIKKNIITSVMNFIEKNQVKCL